MAGVARIVTHGLIAAIVAVGLGAPSLAAEPPYALDHAGTNTINATFTFTIHSPTTTIEKWLIYVPQAPTLHQQGSVSTSITPAAVSYADLSARHRPLLRAVLPATTSALKHGVKVQVNYRATLYGRELVPRDRHQGYLKPSALSATEREHSLAETPQLDFTSDRFKQWLADNRLQRKSSESA
ncbi:MAG TPA: hypothetical protein VG713_20470, partial [Pirellulales bacterium]|nr:hypothetical protein [Pirellulales bacterium]